MVVIVNREGRVSSTSTKFIIIAILPEAFFHVRLREASYSEIGARRWEGTAALVGSERGKHRRPLMILLHGRKHGDVIVIVICIGARSLNLLKWRWVLIGSGFRFHFFDVEDFDSAIHFLSDLNGNVGWLESAEHDQSVTLPLYQMFLDCFVVQIITTITTTRLNFLQPSIFLFILIDNMDRNIQISNHCFRISVSILKLAKKSSFLKKLRSFFKIK